MTKRRHTTRFRFWLGLIRLIGVMVPRRLRADWRHEWEAELQHREELLAQWDRLDWSSKLDLLRRSTSAFWDALWLQTYRWEDAMIQDLRFALRMLFKHPGLTLIATFTLALGIGANTAIFSVVNTVLLKAVPYHEPQQLVWVSEGSEGREDSFGVSADNYVTYQAQSEAFEHLIAYSNKGDLNLTVQGEPEPVESLPITANVFPALGLAPQLGRAFTPEEDRHNAEPVVLLSHSFWQRRFGGDPAIIGQALTMGGKRRMVIGIMPPGSTGLLPLEKNDVWYPLAINPQQERYFNVIGRLKPGFTLEQAQAELNLMMQSILLTHPGIRNTEVRATLLSEKLAGNLRSGLLALFGVVAFVLLIACANVANLQLGRAAMRQKEMAIRAAMGAARLRLVRQMLTESLLLSLLGGATGLLLAVWGLKALVASAPDDLHQIRGSSVDGTVLGFTFLATLLTGLASGLIPALQASQIDLNEALKDGARHAATLRRRWLGRVSPGLVVGEVALTLVVIIGAGLLINSYLRVLAVEPGYQTENLLTAGVRIDQAKYPLGSQQWRSLCQEVPARVRAIPGVKAGAICFAGLPMTGAMCRKLLIIEGRPPAPAEHRPQVECGQVSADFFRTLGIELRAGRSFTELDDDKAPRVAIINEELARRYFSGEDPIGKRIDHDGKNWITIVGLVGNVKRFGLEAEVRPEIYFPFAQSRVPPGFFFAVRTAGDPLDVVAALREQIYELGINEPIGDVMTMEQQLAPSVAPRRFQMVLFGIFAAVALVLASVGVYGVISYSVSRRTHELGIRMALGARPHNLLRMVIRQGMTLVILGVAIGLAAAVASTRVLKSLLFDLSATDPMTFVLIAVLLMAVALLACYLPARRATQVDPMAALRHE